MISRPQKIDNTIVQKIGDDIKFLKAILDVLEPKEIGKVGKKDDKMLRHQFASIISKQYGKLKSEFQKLGQKKDWKTLLRTKKVLREFIEYSGKYEEGVETGRIYYRTLKVSKNDLEAIWAKVKHIGYLLVLKGDHLTGRKELNEALTELSKLTDRNSDPVVECYFYCHRYLGISYHRDNLKVDLDKAEEHYRMAEEYTSHFKGRTGKYNELIARIKGNLGNLAMSKGDHRKALELFKQSHAMFLDLGDKEHIGIAKLQMVEALLYLRTDPEYENVPTYLGEANVLFNEIAWIEGQGRCQKYYTYFYMYQLEEAPFLTPAQKKKIIHEALNYAKLGKASYTQIDKKKEIGRLEGRIEILEQKLREM